MFGDRTERDGGLAAGPSRRQAGLLPVEREGVVRGRTCGMHHRRDQRLTKAPGKGRISVNCGQARDVSAHRQDHETKGWEEGWRWGEIEGRAERALHKSRDQVSSRQGPPFDSNLGSSRTSECCTRDSPPLLVTWSASRCQPQTSGLARFLVSFVSNDFNLLLRGKWRVRCRRILSSGWTAR